MLANNLAACNSYDQGNVICEKCYRNIGFFSKTQTIWEKFNKVNNVCVGFINRNEFNKELMFINKDKLS